MRSLLKKKRAAHFLLIPELLYSPPNDAIINAYLENGYSVDIYAPGVLPGSTSYGNSVRTYQAYYSWIWLFRNIFKLKWAVYACFSGTSEDPLVVVGILSLLFWGKSFSLVDEIKSGSYRGDRSEQWKNICKWAIRRSNFQIVNDESRVRLLREYARIKKESTVIVYPGCFFSIPEKSNGERRQIREHWGVPTKSFVIGSSGGFNMTAGADWMIETIREMDDIYAVIQPLGVTELSKYLLQSLAFSDRIYVENERLNWREAWRSAQALDVGLCIYTNKAPQFQNMGVSSNRLCMFLAMGVPVIASYQKSFEFLEKYNCGFMVRDLDEFKRAITAIRGNHWKMSENCKVCTDEYLKPRLRYEVLKQRIMEL